jgi:hypothetical protein
VTAVIHLLVIVLVSISNTKVRSGYEHFHSIQLSWLSIFLAHFPLPRCKDVCVCVCVCVFLEDNSLHLQVEMNGTLVPYNDLMMEKGSRYG